MRGARQRAAVSRPGGAAMLGAGGSTRVTPRRPPAPGAAARPGALGSPPRAGFALAAPSPPRRRALALGAAAGLGSLVSPLRSVSAFAALSPRPRGFGLTVTPADFDGGRTSRVLRARRFDVIGVRGAGPVEVRVRARGGAWSAWIPLAAPGDHAPDTGTGERASDPIWTGGSDELQLRLARPPRGSLRVHFVAVPAALRRSAARATARARSAVAAESGAGSGAPSGATGGGAAPVAGAAVGRAAGADADARAARAAGRAAPGGGAPARRPPP